MVDGDGVHIHIHTFIYLYLYKIDMAATTTIAQPYQVALVNNDLTNDETLLDVFHSLDHLAAIVNEIFTKIDTRIDAEKTRISFIKARVNVCQQKVQQIKGSTQAITIFSTAKYPAPKELPMYPTLLQESSIVRRYFVFIGKIICCFCFCF